MNRLTASHDTHGGGLASVIAREREGTSQGLPADLHYGTPRVLTRGTQLDANVIEEPAIDAAWPTDMQSRVGAVAVAASVRDATVIGAIRFERGRESPSLSWLHVYRVQAVPFHAGPLAVLRELGRRVRTGGSLESLVRQYWQPTGVWYIREVLVRSLVVIEEVPPASDRDAYVPRWVLYREDNERARAL
jgi:hypothetical protein